MPTLIRLPITNHITGSDYCATLHVGANALPLNFLLDTGSAALAVGRNVYDPGEDQEAKTTKLLMVASYLSSSFTGGVVQTSVVLPAASPDAEISLPDANLAVTYDKRPDNFGNADGILGLAYSVLDNAYLMPADTWQNQYAANQTSLGKECDLDPYFDQLANAGVIGRKFAFSVKRSLMSTQQNNPSADPINQGVFVFGGSDDCPDLYAGDISKIAVQHEEHYCVNLTSLQVGDQPPIAVPPLAPGSTLPSNAVVDSGLCYLLLDQDLFDQVVAAFNAVQAGSGDLLKQNGYTHGTGCDQTTIDLAAWPPFKINFQGPGNTAAAVTIQPGDYWQFDALQPGKAIAVLIGDNWRMGGQSVFGLPLFSNHYVMFDRTAASGHGIIAVARQA